MFSLYCDELFGIEDCASVDELLRRASVEWGDIPERATLEFNHQAIPKTLLIPWLTKEIPTVDKREIFEWSGTIALERLRPALKTTANGRFSKAAKEYHAYKDDLRRQCIRQGFPWTCEIVSLEVIASFGLPKSCFDRKGGYTKEGVLRAGQPHEQKPDLDNVFKPIADALSPGKDEQISNGGCTKQWSATQYSSLRLTIRYRDPI